MLQIVDCCHEVWSIGGPGRPDQHFDFNYPDRPTLGSRTGRPVEMLG